MRDIGDLIFKDSIPVLMKEESILLLRDRKDIPDFLGTAKS